ncbi:MAG: biotin/lipoyl-containing protein, partial [Bacteroidia bacterium]
MAELITLPKMSDTMTEGVIVKWTVKVGDTVKSGDVLAEVETDKATMDMEGYAKGTVLYLAPEGQAIPVDAPIAVVGAAGEAFENLLNGSAAPAAAPEVAAPAAETPAGSAPASSPAPAPVASSEERVKASPLAKKIAAEKGIALNGI